MKTPISPEDRRLAELEEQARLRDAIDEERKRSDETYAIKMVEKIVFGALGVIALAVLGALLALVVRGSTL